MFPALFPHLTFLVTCCHLPFLYVASPHLVRAWPIVIRLVSRDVHFSFPITGRCLPNHTLGTGQSAACPPLNATAVTGMNIESLPQNDRPTCDGASFQTHAIQHRTQISISPSPFGWLTSNPIHATPHTNLQFSLLWILQWHLEWIMKVRRVLMDPLMMVPAAMWMHHLSQVAQH